MILFVSIIMLSVQIKKSKKNILGYMEFVGFELLT